MIALVTLPPNGIRGRELKRKWSALDKFRQLFEKTVCIYNTD
jgi:hypothetical protein